MECMGPERPGSASSWTMCHARFQTKAWAGRRGGLAPTLPLTASWLLRPNQGRSTLGKVLGKMKIPPAKKQVLAHCRSVPQQC